MRSLVVLLLAMAVNSFAASTLWENYNGFNDTAQVHTFRADSLVYTKFFNLSQYSNLRIDILANDSSTAGVTNDSIAFQWGIQTAHPIRNSAGNRDTLITYRLVVDTLNRFTGRMKDTTLVVYGLDGTFNMPTQVLDTASVSGYMTQTRVVSPEWDVLYRLWFKGMTGNKKASFVVLRANIVRQLQVP